MMIALTQTSLEATLADNICGELEAIFISLSEFENQVRLTRKDFISKICDCLEKYSVTEIPTDSILYQKLFLLYVKCVRTHVYFKLGKNRERFQTILNMELQFNDMTLDRTALTKLSLSKKSKSLTTY